MIKCICTGSSLVWPDQLTKGVVTLCYISCVSSPNCVCFICLVHMAH